MTTQELYNQVLTEGISKDEFLYAVRKDQRFKQWVTPLTNYADTVTILKNKGILSEGIILSKLYARYENSPEAAKEYLEQNKEQIRKEFTSVSKMSHPDSQFIEWVDGLLEVKTPLYIAETKVEKAKFAEIDLVNPYELQQGLRVEFEGDYEAAIKKVVKNLRKNPTYYTDLKLREKSKKTRTDVMIPLNKKKDNVVDKDNEMKPATKEKIKKNTSDDLGNKEKGTKKPKGVEILTQTPKRAKGISKVMEVPKKEQKPKVAKGKLIKESLYKIINECMCELGLGDTEEMEDRLSHTNGSTLLQKVADEWGEDSPLFDDLYSAIGNGSQILSGDVYNGVKSILSYYDVLDEYLPYLDVSVNEDQYLDKKANDAKKNYLDAQIKALNAQKTQIKESEVSTITLLINGKKRTMTKSEAMQLMDKLRFAMEKIK